MFFTDFVVAPNELTEFFIPPVVEGTTMVFTFLRGRACDDIPTPPRSLSLSLSLKTIGMFDVVHVSLHF